MDKNIYIEWLKKQGLPFFQGGGICWKMYQGALVPATAFPCYVELSRDEARKLLKESGALFIRYTSNPCQKETEWWYVVCDAYNPDKFSANTRSKINRGMHKCVVKRLDAEWVSQNGYECYLNAYNRYSNAKPKEKPVFRDSILKSAEGPFEYWGVFVGEHLAGYCQCIVENNEVSTNVIKYDPEYLKYYTSYALINSLMEHYVAGKKMTISNGTRSIAHDTNFQDFLLKLGFRKQFCELNIIYPLWLNLIVQTLFPFSGLFTSLPDRNPFHKIRSLLFQEKLKRSIPVGE